MNEFLPHIVFLDVTVGLHNRNQAQENHPPAADGIVAQLMRMALL
jgi:hypothetical protein